MDANESVYSRFMFNFPSAPTGSEVEVYRICHGSNTSDITLQLILKHDTGDTFDVDAIVDIDGSGLTRYNLGSEDIESDTWYCMEVRFYRSNTGLVTAWLDGSLIGSQTSIDTRTADTPDYFYYGLLESDSSQVYIDDVELDTSSIGCVTLPATPTGVTASSGTYSTYVKVEWTKSTGSTGYKVYRDGGLITTTGDVDNYNDTGADSPTITPGTADASDGDYVDVVRLSLSGESIANGSTHTYTVRGTNSCGDSGVSSSANGYRGAGSLTYQWRRSAADSDASYSNIVGGTTDPYDDGGAPADGSGRYYYCVVDATGSTAQDSTTDRGYRTAASSMEGSETSWTWTAIETGDTVRISSDGGATWTWGSASGAIHIPVGSEDSWTWTTVEFS